MKVLVLFGSPRKKYTYELTKAFLEGLDKDTEVEFIDTTKLNISHCRGCNYCLKEMKCIIKDDMEDIINKIEDADMIVLSSPVYFGTVTSSLKVLIDRCQPLYNKRFVLGVEDTIKKKGVLIFTAGGKNKKMIDSMNLVAKFFMLSCGAELVNTIYCLNTDEIGLDKEVLQRAYITAKSIL